MHVLHTPADTGTSAYPFAATPIRSVPDAAIVREPTGRGCRADAVVFSVGCVTASHGVTSTCSQ